MMRKLITGLFGFTIFLGVIGVLVLITIGNNPIIETIQNPNMPSMTMYIFRWDRYLKNLETTINIVNDIQWITQPNTPMTNWLTHTWESMANILFLAFNWLIFVLNLLWLPLKLILYIILIILALFGIPVGNISINGITYIIQRIYELQIPLIPYLTW